ncbi:hypothetical protein L1049_011921 [Liquidambar formosana]|uniref:Kinesin motor domain-containing protein n=1 Tax=Liquidambar formosana TaxID=63359 RepID=A0AAP0RS75_LIQFO
MMISFWGDLIRDEATILYQKLDQHPIIAAFRLGFCCLQRFLSNQGQLADKFDAKEYFSTTTVEVPTSIDGIKILRDAKLMPPNPSDAIQKEIFKPTPTKEFLVKIQSAENQYIKPPSIREFLIRRFLSFSSMKLRIKYFKVLSSLLRFQKLATVGSLKRAVMEVVTTILGGGLHVGILLWGKKVRDDNKTVLQTGISHDNQLDALGFTLEPNSSQTHPPIGPGHSPPLTSYGRLGKEDASERGIMFRALEDIITNTSPASDCVEVSFLQLYMESIQDLLTSEKINIPKTGEVSLPGAAVVKIRDLDHVLQLIQIGEPNCHAANTKLNTESSRSHAILMVFVRRSFNEKVVDEVSSREKDTRSGISGGNVIPTVRKSKLLIVDLEGFERIDKSGSEGHLLEEAKFINLSLTSLGKCINALAENSPHIPTRDSKLTKLLCDSFGGYSYNYFFHLYFFYKASYKYNIESIEKIVEEGGLDALLMLLRSSYNTTILGVASGANANLAMNGDVVNPLRTLSGI